MAGIREYFTQNVTVLGIQSLWLKLESIYLEYIPLCLGVVSVNTCYEYFFSELLRPFSVL